MWVSGRRAILESNYHNDDETFQTVLYFKHMWLAVIKFFQDENDAFLKEQNQLKLKGLCSQLYSKSFKVFTTNLKYKIGECQGQLINK